MSAKSFGVAFMWVAITACGEGAVDREDEPATTPSLSPEAGGTGTTADPAVPSTTAQPMPPTSTPAAPPSTAPDSMQNGGMQNGGGCVPGMMTETGELRGQFGKTQTTVNGQNYFLQVNEWNSMAPQTLAYGGGFFFKMTEQQAEVPTNGGPSGYPSVFIGANSGNATQNSNLPKRVSDLSTVWTAWQWADAGTLGDATANSYNVAYDVWFSLGPEGDPAAYGPSAGFLMVWLYDPPDAQPIGSPTHTDVTIENVPGTWDAWTGANGDKPIISYLAKSPIQSISFDLADFIRDAIQNRPGSVESAWYLSNVFAGFEIWRGGVGLETTSFCVVVN